MGGGGGVMVTLMILALESTNAAAGIRGVQEAPLTLLFVFHSLICGVTFAMFAETEGAEKGWRRFSLLKLYSVPPTVQTGKGWRDYSDVNGPSHHQELIS